MFLYEIKDSNVINYSMTPDLKKIRSFKVKEIQQNSLDDRLLYVRTSDEKVLESSKEKLYLNELVHSQGGIWGGRLFSKIEPYIMDIEGYNRQNEVFNDYFDGKFTSRPLKIIEDFDYSLKGKFILYYLLLTNHYYSHTGDTRINVMENIISLPKSLYLLHLLENSKFSKLVDEDIQEQLNLFEIKQYSTISINELKKMYETKLIPGCIEDSMQQIETTQKILCKRSK